MYFLAFLSAGMVMTSCNDDNDGPQQQDDFDAKIEALALAPKWNNYLLAASEELAEDCATLYNEWVNGYATTVKNAGGEFGNSYTTAVEQTIVQGSIDIAGEVGEQKIGGPNSLAKEGKTTQAVLEVESWYSFNSLDDYRNNIVSIRNSYFGGINATSAQTNSLSAFVASKNATLNTRVVDAISNAIGKIDAMDKPFRNNLIGSKVDAAMDACADLADIFERELKSFVQTNTDEVAYKAILENYADNIVVPTYANMKNKAEALRDAAQTFAASPTQNKLNIAADAWRATRIPWEQSESFLYGPADLLGLDPSLDSWPLDQADIYTILSDNKQSVAEIRSEITDEAVRGFHTIELLLFKGGNPRVVK
jgi:uncharacterized iron-regulated protein